MEQRELMMKMQMIESEANKLNEQLQAIEQQLSDLNSVYETVKAIKGNKEILTNLGKGIFMRAEIKDENLLVNVGNNIILKKTAEETLEIIEEQKEKLAGGKKQFLENLEELQNQMNSVVEESRNKEHTCEHEDCDCEEDCGENCKCR